MLIFKTGGAVVEFEERHTIFDQPGKLRSAFSPISGNTGNYREALAIGDADPTLDINDVIAEHPARQARNTASTSTPSSRSSRTSACSPAQAGTTARTKSCPSPTSTAACRAACRSRAATGGGRATRSASAAPINGLSDAHRDFLAAGGLGLLIGDGQLNYGTERILEAYYAYAIDKGFTLTADYQFITNPAYNADRGPVSIFSAACTANSSAALLVSIMPGRRRGPCAKNAAPGIKARQRRYRSRKIRNRRRMTRVPFRLVLTELCL